jgi:hypothetical protein
MEKRLGFPTTTQKIYSAMNLKISYLKLGCGIMTFVRKGNQQIYGPRDVQGRYQSRQLAKSNIAVI